MIAMYTLVLFPTFHLLFLIYILSANLRHNEIAVL
jgi:hypothetical protein